MYIKIKLLIIVSWKATIIYYMNIGQLSIVQNPLANIYGAQNEAYKTIY